MPSSVTPTFTSRHVVLARAAAAAIAAIMITFSRDHSAAVGLSVFSGFAVMTALIWGLSIWLVTPAGQRGIPAMMAIFSLLAGMVAGLGAPGAPLLFVTAIVWALLTGVVEFVHGLKTRATDKVVARDRITIGGLTMLLGVVLIFVTLIPDHPFYVKEAHQEFVLTNTVIAVGVFGAYAAIVAVYLGIAGFSPQKPTADAALAQSASGKAEND